MTAQALLEAALDPSEREWLVERLIESLAREQRIASDAIGLAWLAEIQHRSAAIDDGVAEFVDWPDVRSRIAARRGRH